MTSKNTSGKFKITYITTNEFEIKFEEREQYLYAFVKGSQDSKSVSIQFLEFVFSRMDELKYDKALIEEDFPNQISIGDLYEVTEYIIKYLKGGKKLAHVDDQSADLDLNQFAETVATNRGTLFKSFGDNKSALNWLL